MFESLNLNFGRWNFGSKDFVTLESADFGSVGFESELDFVNSGFPKLDLTNSGLGSANLSNFELTSSQVTVEYDQPMNLIPASKFYLSNSLANPDN